jgi:hypothetical protein
MAAAGRSTELGLGAGSERRTELDLGMKVDLYLAVEDRTRWFASGVVAGLRRSHRRWRRPGPGL